MTKELNTEIIAVGTELLLGQIANTNAKWISEQLAEKGINTYYHTVVGDNIDRLTGVFQQAKERANTIIVTGGLGPTEDDLSREAFQQLSHMKLTTDQSALQRIQAFFERAGQTMTANNKRQARVFEDSTILENKIGMAPGNLVEFEGVRWIFMPGVPREMKQICTDSVLPYLTSLNGEQHLYTKVLKFIGIGESALEDRLQTMISNQDNPTIAPLATKEGVTIRLTAKADNLEKAQTMVKETRQQVLEQVGDYLYGEDDDTLAQQSGKLMEKQGKTISAAESLTGGLFADKLVASPGASAIFKGAVVCYAPEVKEKVLHVSNSIMEKEGTVSDACARLLAKNVCRVMDTDIGISFTGVAGPDELEGKAPGTVFIGLYDSDGYETVEECHYRGDRKQIRYRAVLKGYEMLLRYLKKNENN